MKPGLATVQERQERQGPFGRKMKVSFFSECFAEGLWGSLGWVCDQWPDALSGIPQAYFALRRTCWWKNTKTLTMMVDPNILTRWKDQWRGHNRGCVWGKIASEWVWASYTGRKLVRASKRPKKRNKPRELGPPDKYGWARSEGTTV